MLPATADEAAEVGALDALGVASGWWTSDGEPGPRADVLVAGGFRHARLEVTERARLFANQQGGFTVACPACGAAIVRAFERAARGWRDHLGPRAVVCPSCSATSDLDHLRFRPPAGYARATLHLASVGSSTLRPLAHDAIAAVWGAIRIVGRRTW